MTPTDIRTRIWERLEENGSTPLRYPSATLDTYISDGERFYVAKTGCSVASTTITQTANTLMYSLPSGCIQVTRVLWSNGGVYYPLTPTTPREMDETWAFTSKWVTQTGTRADRFFIFGLDRIALHPLIASGTESYIVHYKQDIPSTTDNAETMPEEDHGLLVDYALARCLLSEGKVKEGLAEYKTYRDGVTAAQRRLSNADRMWSRGGYAGGL